MRKPKGIASAVSGASIVTAFVLGLIQTGYCLEGGQPDTAMKFPSSVTFNGASVHDCSGVKISPTFYLTAAHCANDFQKYTNVDDYYKGTPFYYDPRVRSEDIISHEKLTDHVTVKSIYLNPTWEKLVGPQATEEQMADADFSDKVSDLALVETETPQPKDIQIPIANLFLDPLPSDTLVSIQIGGYGVTSPTGTSYPLIPPYGPAEAEIGDPSDLIFEIAGGFNADGSAPDPKKNTIYLLPGDSGGPVYTQMNTGDFFVIGINSASANTEGTSSEFAVAARLDVAKSWICSTAQLSNCH